MDQNQQQSNQINSFSLSKITDIVVNVIPIIVIVFAILAVVAFLFYTVMGITSGSFRGFLTSFASGISACMSNVFMAAVLSALKKIISKK